MNSSRWQLGIGMCNSKYLGPPSYGFILTRYEDATTGYHTFRRPAPKVGTKRCTCFKISKRIHRSKRKSTAFSMLSLSGSITKAWTGLCKGVFSRSTRSAGNVYPFVIWRFLAARRLKTKSQSMVKFTSHLILFTHSDLSQLLSWRYLL